MILLSWIICVFVSCVSHAFVSVHCYLVVTCWERADLLALFGDVYCIFVTFPCDILGVSKKKHNVALCILKDLHDAKYKLTMVV